MAALTQNVIKTHKSILAIVRQAIATSEVTTKENGALITHYAKRGISSGDRNRLQTLRKELSPRSSFSSAVYLNWRVGSVRHQIQIQPCYQAIEVWYTIDKADG